VHSVGQTKNIIISRCTVELLKKRGFGVLQSAYAGSEAHTTSYPMGAGGSLFEGKAAWA